MWEIIFPEVKSYCTSENSYVTFTYEYEKALIFDKLLSREFMVKRNQQFEGTERINFHKRNQCQSCSGSDKVFRGKITENVNL